MGAVKGCPAPCAISAAEMLPNILCSPRAAPDGGGGGRLSPPSAAGSLFVHVGARALRRVLVRAPAESTTAAPIRGAAVSAFLSIAALHTPVVPAPATRTARSPLLASPLAPAPAGPGAAAPGGGGGGVPAPGASRVPRRSSG